MTSENEQDAENRATARDVYRQARDQAAAQTDYDVQSGLGRFVAWTGSEPASPRAASAAPAPDPRTEQSRIASRGGDKGPVIGEEPAAKGPVESTVTVAIVEDRPVVIEGMSSWISSDPGQRLLITRVVPDLAALASAQPVADVLIVDLEPGRRPVTHALPALVAAWRRVVVFSEHVERGLILDALDAGACAYVAKDEGHEHLVEAVLAAAADRPYMTRSQAGAILADSRPARPALSPKERQALLLWFQGMSRASVARRMAISENTVREYIDRARVKYAAAGRAAPTKDALLARATEDGPIPW